MGIPSVHSWYKWIVFLNHDEILLILLYTFHYTKNDFASQNSKLPVYHAHHRRNVIFIPSRNMLRTLFNTKSKKNLLLPNVHESKNVHHYIQTHQIYFSFWKKTNQLIWMSWISMNQCCNFLTAKLNSRNLFVFWVYSLQTIYTYIW